MFVFKLFLIALLACVLDGKREGKGPREVGNPAKDVFKALAENSQREDQREGLKVKGGRDRKRDGDVRKEIVKNFLDKLKSSPGFPVDLEKGLGPCLMTCVANQQEDLNKGKEDKEGSGKPGGGDKPKKETQGEKEEEKSDNVPSAAAKAEE